MKQFKFEIGQYVYHVGRNGVMVLCQVCQIGGSEYRMRNLSHGTGDSWEPASYVHKHYTRNINLVEALYGN